jgi:CBS domain-containing protein
MTSPAVTIEADRSLPDAAAKMTERRINRLPVTENGRLIGIVTRADLVRAYVRSDLQLVQTIRDDVLRRAMWVDPDAFEVDVHDGVVRIGGHVERRSTAELIERVTAMVPGVIAVDADLAWSLDDRDIEAPERDYVSPFGASRRL